MGKKIFILIIILIIAGISVNVFMNRYGKNFFSGRSVPKKGEQVLNKEVSGVLGLNLKISEETTGERFQLAVPALDLEISNQSGAAIMVPEEGYSLLFSLRLILESKDETLYRGAGSSIISPVKLRTLPPSESLTVSLSPLENGPGESPLKPGTYQAKVCILTEKELGSPSEFSKRFGGFCSNEVQFTVKEDR
jgi:hypothetical protein